jgi:hypothetical protein
LRLLNKFEVRRSKFEVERQVEAEAAEQVRGSRFDVKAQDKVKVNLDLEEFEVRRSKFEVGHLELRDNKMTITRFEDIHAWQKASKG